MVKGKELYNHYYIEQNHMELAELLDSLYMGMPGADILLTYDDCKLVEQLYLYPNIEKISRVYSI